MTATATHLVLTDDEIVALALGRARAWPAPLPTVRLDATELTAAAARGERSLALRGADEASGVAGPTREAIDDVVPRILAADRWSAVYASPRETPGVVGGTAAFVFDGPEGAAVDYQSPTGLHSLSRLDTAASGIDVLVALAANVRRFGFQGAGEETAVLLVGRSDGERWLAIDRDVITAGRMTPEGFVAGEVLDVSDESAVAALVREAVAL